MRVKALRRHLSEHARTDLADAHVLAAMPGFGGPRLDPVHIPAAGSHALQRLVKQRRHMRDAVAAAKRRLIDLVRRASPTLERVPPDFRTRPCLALLQRWVDPDAVPAARGSAPARFIARSADGKHPHGGPFVDALVEGLRQAARDARALHGRHLDFAELQAEIAVEVDVVLAQSKALAELQPDDLLPGIPGVGRHLAPSRSACCTLPTGSAPKARSAASAASFHAAPPRNRAPTAGPPRGAAPASRRARAPRA